MNKLVALWQRVVAILAPAGDWLALLPIRLLMAYEFGTAGMMKYNGNNWFANVQDNFPFPFNVIPVEISWFMATWAELLGAFGLVIGLFTRFWAVSLIIVTIVAIFAVHLPAEWSGLGELWDSYRVTRKEGSGNFRIPLLFIAMLFPLIFTGAGKLSVDHLLSRYFSKK